jgi:hypothetical protein
MLLAKLHAPELTWCGSTAARERLADLEILHDIEELTLQRLPTSLASPSMPRKAGCIGLARSSGTT